jgi:hypothetical protein
VVVSEASFCKECGAPLTNEVSGPLRVRGWAPMIAAGLSALPGLGHLYRGRPFSAIVWFLGVSCAYAVVLPLGYILHLICAANAALIGTRNAGALPPAPRAGRSGAWS